MNAPEQRNLALPETHQDALRSVWATHPELHSQYTFQQAMRVPAMAICIRNEARAKGIYAK